MDEHVHDWMAWRHVDADRFITDTIMFFKCRDPDCNKKLEVSDVEARLNATERLSAEDAKRALLYARSYYRILDESDTIDNLLAYANILEGK